MTRLLLLLLLPVGAFAQLTISGIEVGCMSGTPAMWSTSCRDATTVAIRFTPSAPTAHGYVKFGVTSGHYIDTSWDAPCNNSGGTICGVTISGLKPATTYYFRPILHPNPNDDVGACNSDGCGAVEGSFTTASGTGPFYPTPVNPTPQQFTAFPSTSGTTGGIANYVTIPITGNGTTECVVGGLSSITPPAGYSWAAISPGTLFRDVLNIIGFGVILDVDQGLKCPVPTDLPGASGRGYSWPALAVDPNASGINDPAHRWIILQTHGCNSADFAPFGARQTPSAKLANFEAQAPTYPAVAQYTGGQVFQGTANNTHHIWSACTEFSVKQSLLTAKWDSLIQYGWDGMVAANLPQWMVVERSYIHGPTKASVMDTVPYTAGGIYGAVGASLFQGNYFDGMQAGINDGGNPVLTTTFGINTPTLGPVIFDNNYECCGAILAINIVSVNSPTFASGFLSQFPYDHVWTHNAGYTPQAVMDSYANTYTSTGQVMCRNVMEQKAVTRTTISGNYINGWPACLNEGMTIMLASTDLDATVKSNLIKNAAGLFANTGVTNGLDNVPISVVSSRNYFTNNLAFKIGVNPLTAAGVGGGSPKVNIGYMINSTPPDNQIVARNTLGYMDFYCDTALNPRCGAFQSDLRPFIIAMSGASGLMSNSVWSNNVYHLSYRASTSQGGIYTNLLGERDYQRSHPATPHSIQNFAPYNTQLDAVWGYIDGSAGSGIGGAVTLNGGSGYSDGATITTNGDCSGVTGQVSPFGGTFGNAVVYSEFSVLGTCDPTLISTSTLTPAGGTGAVLLPAYGPHTAYTWTGNFGICGKVQDAATAPLIRDMTASECATAHANMPGTDVWATNNTLDDRTKAAGFLGYANDDWRCTPTAQSSCAAGANINTLESDLGIVSHISTRVASDSATISYLSPDTRACSVDISSDSGTTWTRQGDGGGVRSRSVAFTGLTASHGYQYRILCYFDQTEARTAGWFAFPSDPSNLETAGTLTTLASATRTVAVPFSLSAFAGAVTFSVGLRAADGTSFYHNDTCTSGPTCSLSGVPVGDYTVSKRWLNGSGGVVAANDLTAEILQVR